MIDYKPKTIGQAYAELLPRYMFRGLTSLDLCMFIQVQSVQTYDPNYGTGENTMKMYTDYGNGSMFIWRVPAIISNPFSNLMSNVESIFSYSFTKDDYTDSDGFQSYQKQQTVLIPSMYWETIKSYQFQFSNKLAIATKYGANMLNYDLAYDNIGAGFLINNSDNTSGGCKVLRILGGYDIPLNQSNLWKVLQVEYRDSWGFVSNDHIHSTYFDEASQVPPEQYEIDPTPINLTLRYNKSVDRWYQFNGGNQGSSGEGYPNFYEFKNR